MSDRKKKREDLPAGSRRESSFAKQSPAAINLVAIACVWCVLTEGGIVPNFMLPSPIAVVKAFVSDFPILMYHSGVSLIEAALGLLIGIGLAVLMAILMDRFRTCYRALYPVMVITQTIPTVAIAPILVLWMGFGMAPKITLVVISTFFPIAVGLLDGFAEADKDAIDLLRSMGATRRQIFLQIKFPSALGQFFSGLKISASYSVVGAVVAEWLGGFKGLGVYMTRVRKAYSFDKMFAVIILIVIISLVLIAFVNLLRRVAMPWEHIREIQK